MSANRINDNIDKMQRPSIGEMFPRHRQNYVGSHVTHIFPRLCSHIMSNATDK